jgi:hypothetical protein
MRKPIGMEDSVWDALVEAVHRSQQLDTALDIIARFNARGHDWGTNHDETEWLDLDVMAQPTHRDPITDAERAVLALAERRHRD